MNGRRGTRRRRIAVRAAPYAVAVCTAALGAICWLTYRELRRDLPPVERLASYRAPSASEVFAADGTLVAELFFEKRYVVPLAKIPPHVRNAFVVAEDAAFHSHEGYDLSGIARAAWKNLIAGELIQGGSTITQQVVKSLLLTPEKTFERKVREVILAHRMERQFSKGEILYLYLNDIYLGSGAYGVEAAAREYFGKPVQRLTLAEGALLAGLPKAPARYSPRRHPERARRRQRYVLRRMYEEGFISRAEREEAEEASLPILGERSPAIRAAPYYVEHVRRMLIERYGHETPYRGGLKVYTTLDLDMQRLAERALRRQLEVLDRRRGFRGPCRRLQAPEVETFLARQADSLAGSPPAVGSRIEAVVRRRARDGFFMRIGSFRGTVRADGMRFAGSPSLSPGDVILVRVEKQSPTGALDVTLDQDPLVEGALVAMESATGFVRAMVGGYDFERSQFNRAVQARRQPGSAFKPLVYAAALDRAYTPASIIVDAPAAFLDGSKELWKPKNFDRRFNGPTRLREALAFSRNVVSVKLANRVGIDYVRDYLRRFGFARAFPRNLSIALGSAEVTPLELVRAYNVFASGGRLFDPVFISKVADSRGRVLEQRWPSALRTLSAETAYLMTSMLEDVVRRGTGRGALALGRPVAGKTGTTDDARDAWFVGFTPGLVAGVWVGFDGGGSLARGETGARAALPAWLEFMREALDRRPVAEFGIPDGIVFANVDSRTGLRASDAAAGVVLESFRRGNEPDQVAGAERARDFFLGDF